MTVSARIQTGTHGAKPKLPDGNVLIFAGPDIVRIVCRVASPK